jgi:hypothetical protein
MARRSPAKPYHCTLLSEDVTIQLRRRPTLDGRGKMFVHCSEIDCQYVDTNQPPCPLTMDLFAEEQPPDPAPARL